MEMTIVGDGSAIQQSLADVPSDVSAPANEIEPCDRRDRTLAGSLTDRQIGAIETHPELDITKYPAGQHSKASRTR